MRRLALLGALLVLAGCGSSRQAAPSTTEPPATTPPVTRPKPVPIDPLRHPAGTVAVRITASTHTPKVDAPWRYTVRVTSKGKPVPARLYLQISFNGAVVGNVGSHLVSNGRWTETIRWPADSRGHPLVFEAKVISSGRNGSATYPVRVR